jgi:hypothetical protein
MIDQILHVASADLKLHIGTLLVVLGLQMMAS